MEPSESYKAWERSLKPKCKRKALAELRDSVDAQRKANKRRFHAKHGLVKHLTVEQWSAAKQKKV